MLEELAKRVMEIMEFAEDEATKCYARGFLAMSKTLAKVYQFCSPPKVYIGWIFEDFKIAEEVSESFKILFKVRREWRRMNNRELPAVFVDFEEWITFYSMRGNQLHPLDTIALRYLEYTDMEEVLKKLARDLAEFFKEYGGEVEWGAEDG